MNKYFIVNAKNDNKKKMSRGGSIPQTKTILYSSISLTNVWVVSSNLLLLCYTAEIGCNTEFN